MTECVIYVALQAAAAVYAPAQTPWLIVWVIPAALIALILVRSTPEKRPQRAHPSAVGPVASLIFTYLRLSPAFREILPWVVWGLCIPLIEAAMMMVALYEIVHLLLFIDTPNNKTKGV